MRRRSTWGPAIHQSRCSPWLCRKFDEAIAVATAARARAAAITPATPESEQTVAGADSILAFARVGAARAALNLGDMANAAAYAQAVRPAYVSDADQGFVFWSSYLENTFSNPMYTAIATAAGGGNRWLSVRNTPFDGLEDPRLPLVQKTVMNAELGAEGGPLVPNSPSSYSTWSGTPEGADITRSAWTRIASALEARYIQAEAEGLTPANLAFINERRAVGGLAALPDPARTDNVWQTGPYPGSTTGEVYGDEKCWPLPLSELQGNPNYD